ncbi:MAG: DUF4142 domain-containing protein [Bacteroidota bacterium]
MKLSLSFLALTFLFACGGHRAENQFDTNSAEIVDKSQKADPKESEHHAAANPGVMNSFATKAAEAGQGEVKLGEMAMEKTNSKKTEAFAKMMVKDHRTAGEELKELAEQKGIKLPSECVSCEATYRSLHNLSTEEFEREYAKKMVADHEQAVELFTNASQHEEDPDLKKWAAEKLPTLKHHLAMAKQLVIASPSSLHLSSHPLHTISTSPYHNHQVLFSQRSVKIGSMDRIHRKVLLHE